VKASSYCGLLELVTGHGPVSSTDYLKDENVILWKYIVYFVL